MSVRVAPELVEIDVGEETAAEIRLWAAASGLEEWQVVSLALAAYVERHMPPSHGCWQ